MDLSQLNFLLGNLVDYQKTLTSKTVSLDRNSGNLELSKDSKTLQGMFDQPKEIDSQKYHVFKAQLIARGASPQAAASLAIVLTNIQRKTGVTSDVVLERASALGLQFSNSVFEQINLNRVPTTQLFSNRPLTPFDALVKNPPEYIPTLTGIVCENLIILGDYELVEWAETDSSIGTVVGELTTAGGCESQMVIWSIR